MDINLTDTQFFIGLLITVILLFLGIYAYLVYKLKDTSGVIPLANVAFKATNKDGAIHLLIGNSDAKSMYFFGINPVIRTIKINGINYDFFYCPKDDFCSLYRTNSKGIYECKRINVNFK